MAEEKYVTAEEAEAAKRKPLGLRPRREPPSIAPHFLEEVRKYLEKEYGSQRIYQGGLRVYTTLDPAAQRVAVRALRDGLRVLDRRARGFVKPEASALDKDGLLPEPLHLDEWDWPFAAGRRRARRGAGLRPHERRGADRRLPRPAAAGRRRLDAAHAASPTSCRAGRSRRSGSWRSPTRAGARKPSCCWSRSRRWRAPCWRST